MPDTIGEAWVAVRPLIEGFAEETDRAVSSAIESAGGGVSAKDLTEKLTPAAGAVALATGAISESYDAAKQSIVAATGASGDALEALLDTTRDVAKSGVTTDLGSIGEVVGQLQARLEDLSPAQLAEVSEQVVKLSEITGGDAAQNVAQITDLFEKWNVPTASQADLLDRVYAAAQRAGTPVDEFIGLLTKNSGPLQRFGFSLEETAGVITQIEQAGGDAQPVLSALNLAFGRLAQDSDDPVQAFQEISREIKNAKTDADAYRIGIEALGSRTANSLVPAIRAGRLETNKLSDSLNDGAGAIDRDHEATQSFIDRLKALRNAVGATIAPAAQYATVIATIAAGAGPVAQGIGAIVAPLRAQQAAAALSGQSLSLAEAATNRYGPTARKAAAAVGILAGAFAAFAVVSAIHDQTQQAIQQTTDETADALLKGALSLEELSTRIDEAGNSITGGGTEGIGLIKGYAAATNSIWDQVEALKSQGTELNATQEQAVGTAIAEGNFQKALRLVNQWQEAAARSGKDLTQTHKEQAAAIRATRMEYLQLTGGLVGITAGAVSLADAQRELTATEEKLARMQRNGRQGTQAYIETRRSLRDQTLNVIESQNSLTGSVLEFVDSMRGPDGAVKNIGAVIDGVREQGRAANLTRDQIAKLVEIARDAIKANEDFGKSAKDGAGKAREEYGRLPGALSSLPGRIGATGKRGGDQFATGARSGAGAAATALNAVPSKIAGIPGRFGELGRNAGDSFVSGIDSYVDDAIAAAGRLAGGAANEVARVLRSGSPSRVMEDYGRGIPQGLAVGIEKDGDLPAKALRRVMARMQAGSTPGVLTVDATAGGSVGPIGGGDITEAFREVVREFGGMAPVIVKGGILDLTEATGQADVVRRRRSVLLGGRRY